MADWHGTDTKRVGVAFDGREGDEFSTDPVAVVPDDPDDPVAEWKRAIDEQRALFGGDGGFPARPARATASTETRGEPLDQPDWARAQRMLGQGELCEALVLGRNSGGLVVSFGALRGFVPATHLVDFPRRAPLAEREQFLENHIGDTLTVSVIEVDPAAGRLVLSESDGLRRQREHQRDRLLRELRTGQVCQGTVTRLCDFGAFVDLGGADGLIHVSELAWRRVAHPRDVLAVGQEVEVQVMRLDPGQRHIGLSIKRIQPNPWLTVDERFQVGQVVHGTITRVVDYGAFAQVDDGGLEGLIHLSELAEGNFMHPRNVVTEGDEVDLVIIQVEPARKRLGLSLRRATRNRQQSATSAES